jgi:hypothetical protein
LLCIATSTAWATGQQPLTGRSARAPRHCDDQVDQLIQAFKRLRPSPRENLLNRQLEHRSREPGGPASVEDGGHVERCTATGDDRLRHSDREKPAISQKGRAGDVPIRGFPPAGKRTCGTFAAGRRYFATNLSTHAIWAMSICGIGEFVCRFG